MNDPLDITLTIKDAKEMDPAMLVSMYEKLRADRNDLKSQRQADANRLRRKDLRIDRLLKREEVMLAKVFSMEKALVEVALRMIQCGMAQHMTSSFVDDTDPDETDTLSVDGDW